MSAVFAISHRLAAETETSGLCLNSKGPHRKPAKRLRWEEEEQGSERSFRDQPQADCGNGDERTLLRRQGGVPVSTGVWRRDQRAAAPDRHKTGNL